MIPAKPFCEHLKALCLEQITDAIKHINAYQFIERDRGLFPYERATKKSFEKQLETNENILKSIDPEYQSIQ